jgi:hypothetical protein
LFLLSRDAGGGEAYLVMGLMPVTYILGASAAAMVVGSLATSPPPDEVLARYFR